MPVPILNTLWVPPPVTVKVIFELLLPSARGCSFQNAVGIDGQRRAYLIIGFIKNQRGSCRCRHSILEPGRVVAGVVPAISVKVIVIVFSGWGASDEDAAGTYSS